MVMLLSQAAERMWSSSGGRGASRCRRSGG